MTAITLHPDRAIGGPARFGAGRRPSWRALALAAGAQAVFVPLALSLSAEIGALPEERLVTVDLSASAPPPPPPAPAPPQSDPVPEQRAATPAVAAPALPPLALAAPVVPAPVRLELSAPAPAPLPPAAAANSSSVPNQAAPAAAPAVVADSGLEASLIAGDPPRYPHESRRKREQGTAVLSVVLGTDGRVETIALAASSGSRRLDAAALKAVRTWRWQPRRQAGQPVKVRGIVEIPFVLTSGRKSHHRADCDPQNPECRTADDAAGRDRRGRMDGRHGDIGRAGAAGEEQPPAA